MKHKFVMPDGKVNGRGMGETGQRFIMVYRLKEMNEDATGETRTGEGERSVVETRREKGGIK